MNELWEQYLTRLIVYARDGTSLIENICRPFQLHCGITKFIYSARNVRSDASVAVSITRLP